MLLWISDAFIHKPTSHMYTLDALVRDCQQRIYSGDSASCKKALLWRMWRNAKR